MFKNPMKKSTINPVEAQAAFEQFRANLGQNNLSAYLGQLDIALISKIVLGYYSENNSQDLGRYIEELNAFIKRIPIDDPLTQKAFNTTLHEAFCLRLTLMETLYENKNFFYSEFFSAHYLNKFSSLIESLLANEKDIIQLATTCVHQTPQKELNQIIHHVNQLLTGSKMSQVLQEIMLVRQTLQQLDSDTPNKMFLNPEFSPALYSKFSDYVALNIPSDKKEYIIESIKNDKENQVSICQSLDKLKEVNGFFAELLQELRKPSESKPSFFSCSKVEKDQNLFSTPSSGL